VLVVAALLNDQTLVDTTFALPAPPPPKSPILALLNDSGASNSDLITNDGRLSILNSSSVLGYEYRVGGAGPFSKVAEPSSFLPVGLVEGQNTVEVRAMNADGPSGTSASFTFVLDTVPPSSLPPVLDPANDTGRSSGDAITAARALNFRADGEAADTLILLRDSAEVARGGPGMLADNGPLVDGAFKYTLRRIDAAGNVSQSVATTVVVDNTPPAAVTGLVGTSAGLVNFKVVSGVWRYEYRVESGEFLDVATPGSFVPAGLRFGANRVEVRAVDDAGNVGKSTALTVNWVPNSPTGIWIGQDNRDYVGPYSVAVPDGIQDIHIQLGGLPPKKTLTFVDIQGYGGSRWQFGGNSGHWKIVVVRARGASTADLFLQADRFETGRSFEIALRFNDGTSSRFWINGGTADPTLPLKPSPASQSSALKGKVWGITPIGPKLQRWLAAWKKNHRVTGT
jgi:hypothetical protein